MERTGGVSVNELHKLYQQFQEVQDTLERGPRLHKGRQQATLQKQAELEAHKQKQKLLKMAADQKSLQLKTNEAKILDLKGKLNQASSNKEFEILKNQIAADTMSNSVLEDEILNSLEKVDEAQVQAAKIDKELISAKADEARIAQEVAAAAPGLQKQAAELQATIAEAEKRLPVEISALYRRLIQAHGAGAFAEVEGSTCTACYVSVPPQHLMVLKTGQVIMCKTCGKMQYLSAEA
jgi:hypothetical protein